MSIEGSTMNIEPFDKFEELGRRALACRHWRWMGGMKLIVPSKHDGATGYTVRLQQDGYVPNPNEHPDLADPATLGCLLALVREAWRTSSLHTRLGVDGWEVRDTYCTVIYDKPTAIVCGLDWVGAGGKSDPNGPHTSEIEALVVAEIEY